MAIVLGKVLGGPALALGQWVIFLLLAPTVGIRLGATSVALSLVVMFVVAFALTALGVCIAWRMTSTQGFHAVMNLFLMPLWFLSGALFPAEGAMGGLRWVMRANPLSYGLDGLRAALYWGHGAAPAAAASSPGIATSLAVSVAFAAVLFLLASRIVSARSVGGFE